MEFERDRTEAFLLFTCNPKYIIFESNEWWLLSIKPVEPIILYRIEFSAHLTLSWCEHTSDVGSRTNKIPVFHMKNWDTEATL